MGERALFSGGGDFHREIRRRVADALPASRVRRGRWDAAVKSSILGVWAVGSYLALLLVTSLLGDRRLVLGARGLSHRYSISRPRP